MTKKQLRSKLKKAEQRHKEEIQNVDRARDRRDYWASVASSLKQRLKMINAGQLEMGLD